MTANGLYRYFLEELSAVYNKQEAAEITSIIFEHFAGIDRATLVKDPLRVIDPTLQSSIEQSLEELKRNKPVQYVTGEAWFYKMKLKVSPAVLIPRPETEELAALAIEFLKHKQDAVVLDIGTGSGCVAIAIKKNVPLIELTAIDISEAALDIARKNALQEKTNINFIQLNFLEKENRDQLETYDVIVSNPPYIPEGDMEKMDKNVTSYEPHLALFVADKQALIFYEQIAAFAERHLKPEGRLFLEMHEDYAQEVNALFNNDFYQAEIKEDMFGKQRMLIVTRCLKL